MWKFNEIFRLSFNLAKAEFKLRNEGTYMGIFWYLLIPLLLFGLLFLIFFDRLGGEIKFYALYLLLGVIIFNFFQKSTLESTGIILQNSGLIKSMNFPKIALIGGVSLKFMFSHLFELFLFLIIFLFFDISFLGFLFYPFVFFVFFVFIVGCCLIISSLTVYFVDLKEIWAFLLNLIWLGTPIFYAIEGQTRLFYLNLFNPLYYFITISRELLIYVRIPELWMVMVAIFYSLLFLFIGLLIFNRFQNKFAEMI